MGDRFNPPQLRRLEMQTAVGPERVRKYLLELDRLRPAVRFAHEANAVASSARFTYDFCLALFFNTHGELILPRQRLLIDQTSMLIVPPFVLHQFMLPIGRQQHIAIHFDLAPGFPEGNVLDGRAPYEVQLGDGVVLPLSVKLPRPAELHERLRSIVRHVSSPGFQNSLLADIELFQVLGEAIELGARCPSASSPALSPRVRNAVDQVMAHMVANLEKDLTLQQLSEIVDLSPSHLNRSFRIIMGRTCMACLHRLRMDRARTLLHDPKLSVKEIARAVGYSDASRFSKSFHKFDGLSPSQYRSLS